MKTTNEKNIEQKTEAYILNKLSKLELEDFEKYLNGNPTLKENVLLEKSIYESLNDQEWSTIKDDSENKNLQQLKKQLRSNEFKQLATKAKEAETNYFNTKNKKSFNQKYFYIAGVAAILIFMFSIVFNNSKTDYYKQYANWENLPSLIEKGTNQNVITEAEALYKEKKYTELIQLINTKIDKDSNYYSYALIYLGSSNFKLGKYEKAHQLFDELTETKSLQSSYGYWYKLLIYLKNKDIKNADNMMKIILQNKNNYNFKQTEILYKKLH